MANTTIEIDQAIIAAATRCNDDSSCIRGNLAQLCQVVDCISNDVHFVKCVDEPACNYKVPFANEYVCNCPVRQELFNTYNL
jgi:hypothetical protein